MRKPFLSQATIGNTVADIILLSLIALVLPLWLSNNNPFLLGSGFYWPILAPLLLALRYGFNAAFSSLLLLYGGTFSAYFAGLSHIDTAYPLSMLCGYGIAILITGEFSDAWQRHSIHMEQQHEHTLNRLKTFRHNFHTLRTSHHILEQQLAGQSLSLNEALLSIGQNFDQYKEYSLEQCANNILDIFVRFTGIQSAALFACNDEDIDTKTNLAAIGKPVALDMQDPIVSTALSQKNVIAVKAIDGVSSSRYVACVPLYDVDEYLHGIIVISQIKFFALKQQNLMLMSVIAGNIADKLQKSVTHPVLNIDDYPLFHKHILRAQKSGQKYDIKAQVLCLQIRSVNKNTKHFFNFLKNSRRGLDSYYSASDYRLVVLLNVTTEQEAMGFIERLNMWSKEHFGQDMEEVGIDILNWTELPADKHRLNDLMSYYEANNTSEVSSA